MNAVLTTIAQRYSCRSYTSQMPTEDELHAIANAAIAAPSAMNAQAWRVIVAKDQTLMRDMETEGKRIISSMEDKTLYERIQSRGGVVYYHAPCMIMVAIDPKHSLAALDCGILIQTAALAATSLGLDSVICGMAGLVFNTDKAAEFKARLGFPEGFEFGMAILLGHAEKTTSPHKPDPSKIHFIG